MCTSPLENALHIDIRAFGGGGGRGLELRRTSDQHLIYWERGSFRSAHVFEK